MLSHFALKLNRFEQDKRLFVCNFYLIASYLHLHRYKIKMNLLMRQIYCQINILLRNLFKCYWSQSMFLWQPFQVQKLTLLLKDKEVRLRINLCYNEWFRCDCRHLGLNSRIKFWDCQKACWRVLMRLRNISRKRWLLQHQSMFCPPINTIRRLLCKSSISSHQLVAFDGFKDRWEDALKVV